MGRYSVIVGVPGDFTVRIHVACADRMVGVGSVRPYYRPDVAKTVSHTDS